MQGNKIKTILYLYIYIFMDHRFFNHHLLRGICEAQISCCSAELFQAADFGALKPTKRRSFPNRGRWGSRFFWSVRIWKDTFFCIFLNRSSGWSELIAWHCTMIQSYQEYLFGRSLGTQKSRIFTFFSTFAAQAGAKAKSDRLNDHWIMVLSSQVLNSNWITGISSVVSQKSLSSTCKQEPLVQLT